MRLAYTRNRLACLNGVPTVLVNHWPLHRETTQILRHPEFGLWCGTDQSARWHIEYNAKVVVYGHLPTPRTIELSGVRFEEASVGYRGSGKLSGHAATGCVKCYPVYRIKAPKGPRI